MRLVVFVPPSRRDILDVRIATESSGGWSHKIIDQGDFRLNSSQTATIGFFEGGKPAPGRLHILTMWSRKVFVNGVRRDLASGVELEEGVMVSNPRMRK